MPERLFKNQETYASNETPSSMIAMHPTYERPWEEFRRND
jgi:hypothetical protein